jgi:hypothetical protein
VALPWKFREGGEGNRIYNMVLISVPYAGKASEFFGASGWAPVNTYRKKKAPNLSLGACKILQACKVVMHPGTEEVRIRCAGHHRRLPSRGPIIIIPPIPRPVPRPGPPPGMPDIISRIRDQPWSHIPIASATS